MKIIPLTAGENIRNTNYSPKNFPQIYLNPFTGKVYLTF